MKKKGILERLKEGPVLGDGGYLLELEKRGWVRGAWETSQTGRRRRCYRLTAEGKKKLAPIRQEWAELFRALKRLTKVSHA